MQCCLISLRYSIHSQQVTPFSRFTILQSRTYSPSFRSTRFLFIFSQPLIRHTSLQYNLQYNNGNHHLSIIQPSYQTTLLNNSTTITTDKITTQAVPGTVNLVQGTANLVWDQTCTDMGPRIDICGYPWIFADTDRYGCHFRQFHGYG